MVFRDAVENRANFKIKGHPNVDIILYVHYIIVYEHKIVNTKFIIKWFLTNSFTIYNMYAKCFIYILLLYKVYM